MSSSKSGIGERRQFGWMIHPRIVGSVSFSVVLAIIFIKPLMALTVHAAGSDLHSYVLLIPFIAGYLIYVRHNNSPHQLASSPGLAIAPFLVGLAAYVAARNCQAAGLSLSYNDYLGLMTLSFVCFVAGGGFLFIGRTWMIANAFPVAFLVLMIPLPDGVADLLETASKFASAEAANVFFSLSGTPVLRDGLVFQLPGMVIEVAQECSGIRSSVVLFVTALLASQVFLTSSWRRMMLVAVVIPLGVLRNGFRIMVIGLLCVHMGPQMIHSIIHKRGGPLFFGLSLIPLFLLLWWLRSGEAKVRRGKDR